ncbi:hypothetical protein MFIFM68171_02252 [Madurella fahalii]|uniref:Uncharacterized protein n=1 Tax=Madurella fahalii TaxID=1157608 RepID=A0ABQ0G2R5_9PEZI
MPFVFPNLDKICLSAVRDVVASRLPGSEARDYARSILENGGPHAAAQEVKRYILPEIQDLQGKTVTRSILDKVWKLQVSQGLWSTAALDMGYIDYITDYRDNKYFRMYHGQAGFAHRRITRDHGQAIVGGRNDSLHYFLLWLGNGHRTANFLKVWQLPEGYRQSRGQEWTDVMMILYESINIKAFSLHYGLLHSGSTRDSSLGLGLNVMTPLVQGRRMPPNLKAEAKEQLLRSPDAQIAY